MSSGGTSSATALANERTRCQICQKRVRLGTPVCKCDGVFCATHVFYSAHACTFDYKRQQRELLRAENPRIVPDKLAEC